LKAIENLEGLQHDALSGICTYGFCGIISEHYAPATIALIHSVIPSIDAANRKYDTSKLRGQRGGRPVEINIDRIIIMYTYQWPISCIAKAEACSESTVRRVIRMEINKRIQDRSSEILFWQCDPLALEYHRRRHKHEER
jgi:hypothetical protein